MEKANEIRLAVVDDAPFIREVVRHIIEANDKISLVAEAINGVEAVEMVRENEIDIILMDIVMPEKTGIEAAKEILEIKPNIKIIACSTADSEAMIMQSIDAGCCSFLPKPFTPKQLTELLLATAQEGELHG